MKIVENEEMLENQSVEKKDMSKSPDPPPPKVEKPKPMNFAQKVLVRIYEVIVASFFVFMTK